MSCQNCQKTPEYREKCKSCFLDSIEKKFNIELRKHFKYQEKAQIYDDGTFKTEICKEFIQKNQFLQISITKEPENTAIYPNSLDEITADFLQNIHNKKKFLKNKKITPLGTFTEKELELYAENNNIQIQKRTNKTPYEKFIEKLSNKNQEFLFGIKNFMEKIK